jgi:saccharopine dehydrogenase (NAD+, L-lysine-forming)
MARIIILGGAGLAGRLIAEHRLERSDVRVTPAARRLEHTEALAESFNQRFAGESCFRR